MIKHFVVVSLLTVTVLAQTSSPPTNPLIPTGISPDCNSFLQTLDTDHSLSCLSLLVSALPGHGTTSTAASLSSALDSVCSSTSCSAANVRNTLAKFQESCSAEITNKIVLGYYDDLYALVPLKEAVCSKDDGGRYCVTEPTTHSVDGNIDQTTNLPSDSNSNSTQTYYSVNPAAWTSNNLPFLLLQPTLPPATLCTPCTRNILTAWITFESDCPYAPGLAQSSLLSGQSALYDAVQSKCGKSFLSGAVQAAGGLSDGGPLGGSSSGSARSISAEFLSTVVRIVASVTIGSIALL